MMERDMVLPVKAGLSWMILYSFVFTPAGIEQQTAQLALDTP